MSFTWGSEIWIRLWTKSGLYAGIGCWYTTFTGAAGWGGGGAYCKVLMWAGNWNRISGIGKCLAGGTYFCLYFQIQFVCVCSCVRVRLEVV